VNLTSQICKVFEAVVRDEIVELLTDIDITKEKVSAKLDRLRDDKAAGADDLLPRFLNSIKKEIIFGLSRGV